MFLDFSELRRDIFGRIERPIVVVRRPHGEIIGALNYIFNLSMDLKFNEPSTASFSYPQKHDGIQLPFYDEIIKDKLIDIAPYGSFIINSVSEDSDGVRCVKDVELVSREQELEGKYVVMLPGTYRFWNPVAPQDTVLQIIKEVTGWEIGRVSPTLLDRYRTFDSVDSQALAWLQNEVQDSFGCVIVFDSFNRTINAIDINEDVPELPIYFSYNNLVKSGIKRELSDPITTQLYVTGADGVDIGDVNPIGGNYIYNLDWYIENGDITGELAKRWRAWEGSVFVNQPLMSNLVSLRNACIARDTAESAALADLRSQRATAENERITYLGYVNNSAAGSNMQKEYQKKLEDAQRKVADLDEKIRLKSLEVDAIKAQLNTVKDEITSLINRLKLTNEDNFSAEQLDSLRKYFKEGTFEDDTFAVYDVDMDYTGMYIALDNTSFSIAGQNDAEEKVDAVFRVINQTDDTTLGTVEKGIVKFDDASISDANIIGGTFEAKKVSDATSHNFICTLYVSPIVVNEKKYTSGTITITGIVADHKAIFDGLTAETNTIYDKSGRMSYTTTTYSGDVTFTLSDCSVYSDKNSTAYQTYTVSQSLYNFANEQLAMLSRPVYEFEVSSANLMASKEFDVFRKRLTLGSSCYLQLRDDLLLTPVLNEVHINFEDDTDFKLVFSNTFRRPDEVNCFKNILRTVTEASRKYNAKSLLYNSNSNTSTWVKDFITNGYELALSQIRSGKDNLVTIDKAGIKVDSIDGVDIIHINNGMIALVDKKTNTAKMAMGHFLDPNGEEYIGILADVIAGTLIAGTTLVIECENKETGVMQFKVDETGVTVNDGRWYMRSSKAGGGTSGSIAIDPRYGIAAGSGEMLTTDKNGTILIDGVDKDGKLQFDTDGHPVNDKIKVWVGMDGQAYFDGIVKANGGEFNGDVYANNFYFKNGDDVKTLLNEAGEMDLSELTRLDLGGIVIDGDTGDINFNTDGSITFPSGSISWDAVKDTDEIDEAIQDARDGANEAIDAVRLIATGHYDKGTFINGKSITTPKIYSGEIYGGRIYASDEDGTYACMSGDCFSLKSDDSEKTRAVLEASDNLVQLLLGAGSSNKLSSDDGRLRVAKLVGSVNGSSTQNLGLVSFRGSNGKDAGIVFTDDNGIIFGADYIQGLHLTFS